jgi:hypothetical protein
MAIDWNQEVEHSTISRTRHILNTEAPATRKRGPGGLESMQNPAPADSHAARVELLRDQLGRRSAEAKSGEKPDPALAKEIVNGARSGLAKVSDPNARFSLRERIGLEAVVLADGTRPSLLVRDGFVDLTDPGIGEWDEPLRAYADTVRKVISAVGRINIPENPGFAGTCFVVAPGLVITNRHVLEVIARQGGDGSWILKWPGQTTVDFVVEDGATSAKVYPILGVKFAGPDPINETIQFSHLDAAVLSVDFDAHPNFPAGVKLEKNAGALGPSRDLYIVGFPGRPRTYYGTNAPPAQHETSAVLSSVFNWKFGVKKLAPGRVDKTAGQLPDDPSAWVFSHDASTLGGNSGSPVVDLGFDGGRVIGLHFGGLAREENWAHAMAKIEGKLQKLNLTWI